MTGPIRIAIIGGGMGGLTLANALVHRPLSDQILPHHPGFELHVYEARPEFSERNAFVGLGINAKKALKHCVPDAKDMLRQCGGVTKISSLLLIGSGDNAGAEAHKLEPLSDSDDDKGTSVLRPRFLHALKSSLESAIPQKNILHTSKRLASIAPTSHGSMEVSFEDGQVETFDAVIGADGYRGPVRHHVLGDKADQERATASGFWDCRNLVSQKTAKRVFFEPVREALLAQATMPEDKAKVQQYFGDDAGFHEIAWAGNSGFILHSAGREGPFGCIISGIEKEPWKKRKRLMTRDDIKQHMQGWDDGPVFSAALDLMFTREQPDHGDNEQTGQNDDDKIDQDHIYAYSQWHHKKTSTYNKGRVCIIGDAAHASTPWQGSGTGIAIEDAMILSHLLWNTPSANAIDLAFETFTKVRKDRCQHVIDSSERTGKICCAQHPGLGRQDPTTGVVHLDPKKMLSALQNKWDKIYGMSPEDDRKAALEKFEKRLEESKA